MNSHDDTKPVDLGRLFEDLPRLAPGGYSITVRSDGEGSPTGLRIDCNDPEQQADVVGRINAGLYAPVREDEA